VSHQCLAKFSDFKGTEILFICFVLFFNSTVFANWRIKMLLLGLVVAQVVERLLSKHETRV
jgi:hypothetical protein